MKKEIIINYKLFSNYYHIFCRRRRKKKEEERRRRRRRKKIKIRGRISSSTIRKEEEI
jgi:hypothetical protein